MSIAYALRAEYEGTVDQHVDDGTRTVPVFAGGLVRAGDRDLNIAEELDRGDGRIVVAENDLAAIIVLDAYPALKRVPAGDDAPTVDPYADVPAGELRERLRSLGQPTGGNRAALAARLEAAESGIPQPSAEDPASGDLGRAGTPDQPNTDDAPEGDA